MACDIDYIEFVCRQLSGIGTVRPQKMFGDYCIYINGKPVVLCCDNISYVRKYPEIEELMTEAECGYPFPGSKEWYILDVEHGSEARRIVGILDKIVKRD